MKAHQLTTRSLLCSLSAAAAALVISQDAAKAADYPTTILNDNPSAYYRFEETSGTTAFDSSVNGNAATYNFNSADSPILGEAGIDTNSILFTGPGPGGLGDYGYVNIPASSLITPLQTDGIHSAAFSAELWVQPTSLPPGSETFTVPIEQGAYNAGNPEGWNIYVSGVGAGNGNSGYFYLDMRPNLFQGIGAAGPITFGQWYHLVLTYDGTNSAMFYVNGVPYGPYNAAGYLPYTADGAHVGNGQDVGWYALDGGVDEVAFYTNVLTANQVMTHYKVGTNSFRLIPTGASLVTDPTDETNYSGLPVTFSVTAAGTPPLTYIWMSNSVPVGPNAPLWTFTAQYPANNNANIEVIVTNAYGSVTSPVVTLTVLTNLNFVSPPGSIARNVGSHAAFHVTANGAVPITYQWSVSSNSGASFLPIAGATSATYWLSNVQMAQNNNQYSVAVTNPFTSASASATLTVQARTDPAVPVDRYSALVMADNPVAYWRLDEASGTLAEDAVGTFDGAYTPGTGTILYDQTDGIPGSTDPAAGVTNNATVQAPWAPELNPDTAWSLELWIEPYLVDGNYRTVIASQYNLYPNAYNGWYIYQQPSATLAFVPQPGNFFIQAAPTDPANANLLVAGKWYHCVVTDDNTNWNFYINGQLQTTYPVADVAFVVNGDGINVDGTAGIAGAAQAAAAVVIGQRDDFAFDPFEGNVDETAIYNYALSPAQVYDHYIDGIKLTITKVGTNAVVSWPEGVLQQASTLHGEFTDVLNATSPYTNSVSAAPKYYRARLAVP
jgi:Concanavalin A-like lectin/glucanases superfamily